MNGQYVTIKSAHVARTVGGGMKRSQSVLEMKKAANVTINRTQEQVLNKLVRLSFMILVS